MSCIYGRETSDKWPCGCPYTTTYIVECRNPERLMQLHRLTDVAGMNSRPPAMDLVGMNSRPSDVTEMNLRTRLETLNEISSYREAGVESIEYIWAKSCYCYPVYCTGYREKE